MAVGTVINWLHGILVTRLRWAFSNELESLFKVWYVVEPFFMSLHYWTTRTLGDLWAATFNFQPFEPSWLRPLRPSGTQAVWPRHSIHSMHAMRCIALVGLQLRMIISNQTLLREQLLEDDDEWQYCRHLDFLWQRSSSRRNWGF